MVKSIPPSAELIAWALLVRLTEEFFFCMAVDIPPSDFEHLGSTPKESPKLLKIRFQGLSVH